jgi:hypothetical protein
MKCIGFVFLLSCALNQGAMAAAWPTGPDGDPFFVEGVTFTINNRPEDPLRQRKALQEVKAIGANLIRTWGVGEETQDLLDNAEKEGLKVLLGLWVEHGRNGAEGDGNLNYATDEKRKQHQQENLLRDVARYKDHPALFGWGLGNEVVLNIGAEDQKVAYAKYLEEVVQEIKKTDPNHPIISVSAWTVSVPYWEKYTPSLDGYGINSYGPAASAIPNALKELGAIKPYLVTEFGPRGAWDSPKDEFGVPQMPTDVEKYEQISRGWGEWIEGNRAQGCAGGFVFNFGDDDAPTSIWLDFYVKGRKRPAYWATREAFSGRNPEAPLENFEGLMVSPKTVQSGGGVSVGIEPLTGDELADVTFTFSPEFGGRDNQNRMLPAESKQIKGRIFQLRAPAEPGVYRIYASKNTAGGNVTITQGSVKIEAAAE